MGWELSESGWATMTHYTLPIPYVAACGCVQSAPTMPSAALNVLAFGSSTSFGPSCGLCAKLTLISTPLAPLRGDGSSSLDGDPDAGDYGFSFSEEEQADGTAPSVVVKIVDSCPLGPPWCNATAEAPNQLGSYTHFDLAWDPQQKNGPIPPDFFPGTHDFGVYTVSYQFVDCSAWRGFNNPRVVGSDWVQQDSACCPKNPPLPSSPLFNNTVWTSEAASRGMPKGCPNYADTLLADAALVPNTSNPLSKHDHDGPIPGTWSGGAMAGAPLPSWLPQGGSLTMAAFLWSLALPSALLAAASLPVLS